MAINGTAVKPYQQPSRSKSEESLAFGSTTNVKTYSTSSRRSSALVEEAAEIVEASKKLPNLEGGKKADSAIGSEKNSKNMGNCPAPNTGTTVAATSEAAELPRLVGTKSQASTASSRLEIFLRENRSRYVTRIYFNTCHKCHILCNFLN